MITANTTFFLVIGIGIAMQTRQLVDSFQMKCSCRTDCGTSTTTDTAIGCFEKWWLYFIHNAPIAKSDRIHTNNLSTGSYA
jgi:hypothetical protein